MRLTSIIAAVLVVAGLWYWFEGRHSGDPGRTAHANAGKTPTGSPTEDAGARSATAAPDPAVPVVVMQSTARDAVAELIVRGRTQANRSVDVAAETAGRVVSPALPAGTQVTAGQVLCRLNPGIRAAELAEAEAGLAEAQAEAQAANQLKRKGFAAETTAKARQAALRAAQARLDRVRWDIAQLEIKAPFDGVLESDSAETGALMGSGSVCATVIDLTKVKVAGYVAEQDIDQLSLGNPANAQLINGVQMPGTISFVARMADPNTRTYAVEVTMANPGTRIRDGMTAELLIPLATRKAHLLPQSSLTLDDGGRLGVRIADNGRAKFTPVAILRDTTEGVWVTGLAEKATIVIIGQEFVRDGRAISPVDVRQMTALGGLGPELSAADAAAIRRASAPAQSAGADTQ